MSRSAVRNSKVAFDNGQKDQNTDSADQAKFDGSKRLAILLPSLQEAADQPAPKCEADHLRIPHVSGLQPRRHTLENGL